MIIKESLVSDLPSNKACKQPHLGLIIDYRANLRQQHTRVTGILHMELPESMKTPSHISSRGLQTNSPSLIKRPEVTCGVVLCCLHSLFRFGLRLKYNSEGIECVNTTSVAMAHCLLRTLDPRTS